MKTNRSLSILLSLTLIASPSAQAGRGTNQSSSAATPTAATYVDPSTGNTTTTTLSTSYIGPTVKEAGQSAAKSNNSGMMMGVAAAGITGACAASTCGTPGGQFWCAVCLSGLVGSIMVTMNMAKARKQSTGTVQAVTAEYDPLAANGTASADSDNLPTSVTSDPEWQTAMSAKKKLESQGWKFDTKKGTVTSSTGKTISSSLASSPDAMRAAGGTDAQIKDFQNKMNEAMKKGDLKAKGMDGTDMFAEGAAGGGPSSASQSAASSEGTVGYGFKGQNAKMGINRDPAQVAGMKKDYFGSPIGVSQDTLFGIMDRRYQLHREGGNFLSP